jgi:hypothetical protein
VALFDVWSYDARDSASDVVTAESEIVSECVGGSHNEVNVLENDREAAVWLFYEEPCLADGRLDVG